MIYILTGPVRTGKTSALLEWSNNRLDVVGCLCPDDENGKRYFLNIKSEETHILELESETESDEVVSIGPFHFLKKAFDKVNEYLIHLKDKSDYSYLIIDELGKLELKNQGLHNAAKSLIPHYLNKENIHLILIVRESLLEEVISYYNITNHSVIKKEDLVLLPKLFS